MVCSSGRQPVAPRGRKNPATLPVVLPALPRPPHPPDLREQFRTFRSPLQVRLRSIIYEALRF